MKRVGRTAGTATSRRTLAFCSVVVTAAGLLAACGASESAEPAARATLELALEPTPPVVGPARFELRLTTPDGAPLTGATVRVEGNMNHAGMVPEFADAEETEPGTYAGGLEFTMGGDWFLLVEAEAPGGERFDWKEDVPGVRSH